MAYNETYRFDQMQIDANAHKYDLRKHILTEFRNYFFYRYLYSECNVYFTIEEYQFRLWKYSWPAGRMKYIKKLCIQNNIPIAPNIIAFDIVQHILEKKEYPSYLHTYALLEDPKFYTIVKGFITIDRLHNSDTIESILTNSIPKGIDEQFDALWNSVIHLQLRVYSIVYSILFLCILYSFMNGLYYNSSLS